MADFPFEAMAFDNICIEGTPATAGPQKVAQVDFDGNEINVLTGFDPATGNQDGGGGDFFGVGSINNWPQSAGVPFSLADDSQTGVGGGVFPGDTEGVFGQNANFDNNFFGISDSDEFGEPGQTATWDFDVAGFENLELSIDMGGISDGTSFGGFVPQTAVFTVSLDGGATQTAFSLAATTNTGNFTFRPMDNGNNTPVGGVLEVTGDNAISKFLAEDGSQATNTFLDKTPASGPGAGLLDKFSTSINGTGSVLTLTLVADFPFEAMAFDNICIDGTPVGGGAALVSAVSEDTQEGQAAGGFTIRRTGSTAAALDVMYVVVDSSTTASPSDFTANPLLSGTVTIPTGASQTTIDISAGTDGVFEGIEQIVIAIQDGSDYSVIGTGLSTVQIIDGDVAPISALQGSELESPFIGVPAIVEAIVVGDFQGSSKLSGFYLQEEEADYDADDATSEGIFVFEGTSSLLNVALGDKVEVSGTVTERDGSTSLINITGITLISAGNTLPAEIALTLPAPAVNFFERYESMRVGFAQQLFAVDLFNYGRYNEARLSGNPFLQTGTNVAEPGAGFATVNDFNLRNQINLDDDRDRNIPSSQQNRNDVKYTINNDGVTAPTRGAELNGGINGILGDENRGQETDLGFASYILRPLNPNNFFFENNPARPTEVPNVGGDITIAAYNVLNYFTTFGSRGAFNATEFARQQQKLAASFVKLNADIVGLQELENNTSSLPSLVSVINGVNGFNADVYDFIQTGRINRSNGSGDEIKVGIIYKKDKVEPLGNFAVLNNSFDPAFFDNSNRPILAQSFRDLATGEIFTVASAHLKSKGSPCDGNEISPGVFDPDTDEGSSSCNLTRESAMNVFNQWVATDPTGVNDSDFILVGDLNSYAKEEPLDALIAGGFANLVDDFNTSSRAPYSFVFGGPEGTLDYTLASPTMAAKATGAEVYHINADFPVALDYSTFNQPFFFQPDEFRASDHDPIIAGFSFAQEQEVVEVQLYDTDQQNVIASIQDGDTITLANLDTRTLGLVAVTNPEIVGSVSLDLSGAFNFARTEGFFPYSIFGDQGRNNIFGQVLPAGDYTLTTRVFSERLEQGEEGQGLTVSFTLVEEEMPPVAITQYLLYNADTDEIVGDIQEGSVFQVLDLDRTNLGIVALTDPTPTGSVALSLTGPSFPNGFRRTEGFAPYSVFGDQGIRDINGDIFAAGSYNITGTPFTEKLAQGAAGNTVSINFEVQEAEVAAFTSFSLYDAASNTFVRTMNEGEVIDMTNFPGGFSIVAETTPPAIDEVVFTVDGSVVRTETVAPYAIAGDNNGNFVPFNRPDGNYALTVTGTANAVALAPLSINFSIVNTPSAVVAFPVPTTGLVNVDVQQAGELRVLDANGTELFRTSVSKGERKVIDLTGRMTGKYMIQHITAEGVQMIDVLKK